MAFQYRLYGGATRPDAISGLSPQFQSALEQLYASAPPEVQKELGLASAYRSPEVQRQLWLASDRTGRTVAAPGKSKHQSGMAADLYGFGLKNAGNVSQATKDWVHENAKKFSLYFPMDYEPWHIQMMAQEKAQQMQQAGYSPDQIKAAFLSAIASGESPGYDVMYGGRKFSDYSKHPHALQPIFDPNHPGQVIGHADVAGRYQFKGSTWDELAKKYGYKDFTPQTQDQAAWQYANDIFKAKTGGSLEEALKSNDPGRINAAAQVLNQTWTSLPGGKEQSKGYGGKTFYDVYSKGLGGAGGTGVHPPNPTVGTPGPGIVGAPPAAKEKETQPWWKRIGAAMADAGATNFGGVGKAIEPNLPPIPGASVSQLAPVAPINPQQEEMRRQMLAMAMARLNAGTLWG